MSKKLVPGHERQKQREAEFANDPDPKKMRCKKRITQSQGTCKHRKRGQQIKYRPLRAARQAALPLGRYFYPILVPEQPRVSSLTVSLSLLLPGVSSLLRTFTRRLRLGKGCGHGAHLLGVLLWLFRSPVILQRCYWLSGKAWP